MQLLALSLDNPPVHYVPASGSPVHTPSHATPCRRGPRQWSPPAWRRRSTRRRTACSRWAHCLYCRLLPVLLLLRLQLAAY